MLTRHRANVCNGLGIFVVVLASALSLAGCKGAVVHPEPGEPNSEKYCADRNDSENNCSACTSQPGCGWCDEPQEGRAHCQPGTTSETPGTCRMGWALSTEDCEPPPPPPPAAPPPGGDGESTESGELLQDGESSSE